MDLKDKLIREVAEELGVSEELCKGIIDHQFNSVRLFIHANPVGEIHLPRIGRLVASQKMYDRVRSKVQSRKEREAEAEVKTKTW